MVPFIYTARENHGVRSPADYLVKHAAFMAKLAKRGARFTVHDVHESIAARIDANRWLVDCDCGNCCATDPEWGIACCYACGAVYRDVVFPEAKEREQIEAVLIGRTKVMTRGWGPGETVHDLAKENISVGARVPQVVLDGMVVDDIAVDVKPETKPDVERK